MSTTEVTHMPAAQSMVPGPLGKLIVSGTNHDGTGVEAEIDFDPATGAITGGKSRNDGPTATPMLITVNTVVKQVDMPSGLRNYTAGQINSQAGVTNLSQIENFSIQIV